MKIFKIILKGLPVAIAAIATVTACCLFVLFLIFVINSDFLLRFELFYPYRDSKLIDVQLAFLIWVSVVLSALSSVVSIAFIDNPKTCKAIYIVNLFNALFVFTPLFYLVLNF
ncbi:MAG: hypothetical protein GX638_15175 [Crenarchaeota archaeon]|nr:hypothetical protein [Thermoproteota archaeon]